MFPPYPDFREIRFEDKTILCEALKTYEPQISEYTFTNLYVWRETHQVLLSQIEDVILVKRKNPELNDFFLFPPIGEKKIGDVVNEMLSRTGKLDLPPLYGLNKLNAESLKKIGFTTKQVPNNWDYVYLVKDLIDLLGEKYYTKRKNIQKCLAEFKPEYRPITNEIIDQCVQMQTSWCDLKNCDAISGLEAEHRAIKEAFLHFNELSVFGGAILIEGTVEAFTLGEKLNNDTAVIHFEKANPNVTGLYQVINQWFCSRALQGFKYVNREQDLGISGLRRAKQSYHPIFFIEKFLAFL